MAGSCVGAVSRDCPTTQTFRRLDRRKHRRYDVAMTIQTAVRSLPVSLVSVITGADVRSVERWRTGTEPRRSAFVNRLDDLVAILDLLGPSMTNKGKQAWLTSRSGYLGMVRPLDLLAKGDFDRVAGAARAYSNGDSI